MKKNFILVCALAFSIAIVSCQKELEAYAPLPTAVDTTGLTIDTTGVPATGIPVGDITGTWNFISLAAKTMATNQMVSGPDVQKTVTTSEYTSENNTGTITFDATKTTSNNLSYAMSTIAHATIYENGVLTDTFSLPFQAVVPASSSSANYTKIGTDSLYFQSGSLFSDGVTQNSRAGGVKLKRAQDKLYLLQSVYQTTTTTVQGQAITSVVQASIIVTLQR